MVSPLSLYTVVGHFDDFTYGIEQYDAETPEAAMAMFVRYANCLEALPPEDRSIVEARHIKLLKIVSLDGFWVWLMAQSTVPAVPTLLGGHVIRTAQSQPR